MFLINKSLMYSLHAPLSFVEIVTLISCERDFGNPDRNLDNIHISYGEVLQTTDKPDGLILACHNTVYVGPYMLNVWYLLMCA